MLRQGSFRPWFTDEARNVLGYVRSSGQNKMGLIINNSPNSYQLELSPFRSDTDVLTDLLTGVTIRSGNRLLVEVAPFGCLMLQ
ncbi:hypothetical protein D3C81_1887780 [compost metagenome]